LKPLLRWGPVAVVMALIFFASSLSDPGLPAGGMWDKAAHFIAYGALGAALVHALAMGQSAANTARWLLLATLLATVYGVTDEIHQYFVPPRTPDILDVAADAAGAAAGALAMAVLARVFSAWYYPSRS
jgi:VanZ family protein